MAWQGILNVTNLANAISGNKFEVNMAIDHSFNGRKCFIQFVSKWESFTAAKEEGRIEAIEEARSNHWPRVFVKGFVIGTDDGGLVCFVSDSHMGLYEEFLEYIHSADPKNGGSLSNLDEFLDCHC